MTRPVLSTKELLKRIQNETGSRRLVAAADRLLEFGDSLGAQRIGRQASISVRLAGAEKHKSWLSLFFVDVSGNVNPHYRYLWERQGIPAAVASRYERQLKNLFGDEILEDGVPATTLMSQWESFSRIVKDAADAIKKCVGRFDPEKNDASGSRTLTAMEGVVREQIVYRRSRSAPLRQAALKLSDGVCACCENNFGELLGGRGARVLQVHHKDQLSLRAHPKATKVDDLAVVCANCHMLIHADPETALPVGAIRGLWRGSGNRRRNRKSAS